MIRVKKDYSQNLTLFTVSGDVSVEEMITEVENFFSSQPTKLAMWDLLDVRGDGFAPSDVDKIISVIGKYRAARKDGKTALVASSDYAYGLSRMHKAKAEMYKLDIDYYVTRNLDDALKWLGVVKINES